ncbi:DUF4396 domain-containing protein [Actinacidiphila sp. bgisy167]|uniref:DUF4396 domain-containing protein n=1 Tax=Actinacidiphila sp. bgisy167 TaxID=3413797 RepID=UPI003D7392FF
MEHVEHFHRDHHDTAQHDDPHHHDTAQHDDPHHHQGHGRGAGSASWGTAALATLHCLTGCAIGEILGMAIGTALGWHDAPTMVLAIALAFVFGYALTVRGVLRAGLGLRSAVRVALAADTVSILFMEIADNGTILLLPGAMEATLSDALFWVALALAFAVAFLVTAPVNKWMIGRGKGHAVVHHYH